MPTPSSAPCDSGRSADYSTTTELADTLQREADVPFRIGHHFASELVNYGAADIICARARFRTPRHSGSMPRSPRLQRWDTKLSLSEEQFCRALTAENMVTASKGLGGPQPSEVARMRADAKDKLAADEAWLETTRTKLADAAQRLDQTFMRLHD